MTQIIETTLFYIIRLFSSTLEMLFAYLLLNAFFDDRYKSKLPKYISFVVSGGILLALQETGHTGNIKTAVEMLLIFLIALFIYEGQKRIKVIFGFVFSLCLALSKILSDFMFLLFIDKIIEKIPLIDTEGFFYRLISIEMPNLFMLAIIILIGLFTKKKSRNISLKYLLLLLTVPATTLFTLTVYQYYTDLIQPGESINVYIVISSVGLVFINILVFALFARLQSQFEIKREADLLNTQMRLEKESFRKLEDSYNYTREIRHDLKNHILGLRGIVETGTKEELLAYLDTLTDTVEEATYISISGNSAVDAVLNEKLLKAQKNSISTQFDIDRLENCKISAMDICTIISNALDNSLEACLKINDNTKRYISLKIKNEQNLLLIAVKNPVFETPKKKSGIFETLKEDKLNHGLGLKSIKRTTEKYGGDMLTKVSEGEFNLIISLNYEN